MTVNVTNRQIRITTASGRRSINIGGVAAQLVDTGGRQGLPGRDGQDAGLIERTSSSAIGGHVVVRSVTASTVERVDATDPAHGDDTLGITTNAAAPGDVLRVQRGGALAMSGWTWLPLQPVYLGLAPGSLTQTPPDPGDGFAFSQVFGYAESETSIIIDPQPPIYF